MEPIEEYNEVPFLNQHDDIEYLAMNEYEDEWFKLKDDSPFKNIFEFNDKFEKQILFNKYEKEELFIMQSKNEECIKLRKEFGIENSFEYYEIGEVEVAHIDEESFHSNKADFGMEKNDVNQNERGINDEILGSQISTKIDALCDEIKSKKKKCKFLTLSESRKKLALRADVMNKNFF